MTWESGRGLFFCSVEWRNLTTIGAIFSYKVLTSFSGWGLLFCREDKSYVGLQSIFGKDKKSYGRWQFIFWRVKKLYVRWQFIFWSGDKSYTVRFLQWLTIYILEGGKSYGGWGLLEEQVRVCFKGSWLNQPALTLQCWGYHNLNHHSYHTNLYLKYIAIL